MIRAVVIGAGIAGLSTALALERRGLKATILERAPGPREVGYMLDFFGPGYDAAERLELLDEIAEIHYPIERVVFTDARGREQVSLSYPLLRDRIFGGRHFNFLRGDLEALLARQLRMSQIRYGVSATGIRATDAGADLTLDDGSALTADVLVGADGIHSFTRSQLFGPEGDFLRPLHHVTAAFVIDRRIETGFGDAFVTLNDPGRMVAAYPISGGRTATFFAYRAEAIDRPPSAALRDRYGDLGWIVPELLAAMPDDRLIYADTVDQIVMDRWHGARVGLAGDAAWCVTLLAGQGASLAVAGGEALAHALASTPEDVPAALARYEANMRPLVDARQRAGRRTADWFVPDNRWRLWLRQMALRASSWPVVASMLARGTGTRAAS